LAQSGIAEFVLSAFFHRQRENASKRSTAKLFPLAKNPDRHQRATFAREKLHECNPEPPQ
jgi:hypothetical protein